MLKDADVPGLLASRKAKHSLPRPFYTDADIFRLDLERIFYRSWLFAVPACEIPKAGNYVTYQVGLYSVIIVRGHDGVIRAFHNSCRHRGSTLCRETKGSRPKIVCPYHQWTYELDGRLLFARDMDADFDASAHGLNPVHCRDVAGLVYVCLADEPPAFDGFAEQAARYLAPHDLSNSKVAYETTTFEKGNWKLVWENNRECYHCAGNHPSLTRTFPEDPRLFGAEGEKGTSPVLDRHIERCELAGAPPPSRRTRWGTGGSCACRCSARPRATRWTGRRRSPGRTPRCRSRTPARCSVQLSLHLEPLPRRSLDRLPRHPGQRDGDRGLHEVAGAQGCAGGRRL